MPSSAIPQHLFTRSNSIFEGKSIDSPRQQMHRASDSAFLNASSGPYSRSGPRGPLLIPDHVMSQQQQQQPEGVYPDHMGRHMNGSAENLFQKVKHIYL